MNTKSSSSMVSCKGCSKFKTLKDERTIQFILNEYNKDDVPWFLGFSGGKDSTALLMLTYEALKLSNKHKQVNVIYCDTGVEIPKLSATVKTLLNELQVECDDNEIPLKMRVASPALNDRFFVKIIGRGYPPPTNKFRWCTNRLRINPVKKITDAIVGKDRGLILLGVRKDESPERKRTIEKHQLKKKTYSQKGNSNLSILGPIEAYSTTDVWGTIYSGIGPKCIKPEELSFIYRIASGECPTIRDPKSPPCGKGRFGCWTCTVVRKDKSLTNMAQSPEFNNVEPLLDFRNWLAVFRDKSSARMHIRRNGQEGLGPFTIKARLEILERLLIAQTSFDKKLISKTEIKEIFKLWEEDDLVSTNYLKKILNNNIFPGVSSLFKEYNQ